ncbi:MAG: hypothetical protein LBH49_00670 [Puniceicoccales bacterium]|jgi:hypothetical protein|nr:hypothetical protein [Puniceicoccales bacterium]
MARGKKLKPGALAKYRKGCETAVFINSDFFFVSDCGLPSNKISYETLADIASLNLETSSPFQEDDMFYGFFTNRKECSMFIYSTLKNRIIETGDDTKDYMFPEFLPALLINIDSDGIIFKRRDRIIVIEKTNNMFSGIRLFNEEKDSHLPMVEFHKHRVIISEGIRLFVTVTHEGNVKKQKLLLKFKDKAFWHMELHDRFFNSTRMKSKILQLLSFDVSILSTVVAIFAFSFSAIFGQKIVNERSISGILAAKESKIKNLKEKDKRLNELASFSKKRQAYFKILEDINKLRPSKMTFNSVKAIDGNKLEISAVAKMEIREVNAYTDKLLELNSLQTVKCVKPITSGGETRFSIIVEGKES